VLACDASLAGKLQLINRAPVKACCNLENVQRDTVSLCTLSDYVASFPVYGTATTNACTPLLHA